MRLQEHGRRVRIYIGESDQWHGRPLYAAIVQEARRRGVAGATVARGIMGYGAHSAIHEPHLFSLSHDLPIVVEIVDDEEKVRAFLPCLDEMVREGMITTSEVEIIVYTAHSAAPEPLVAIDPRTPEARVAPAPPVGDDVAVPAGLAPTLFALTGRIAARLRRR